MSKASLPEVVDGHQFKSKRNTVTYMKSSDCVRKKFFDRKAFENELQVYHCLEGKNAVRTGEIVSVDSKALIIYIRYLHGPTMLELLSAVEEEADTLQGVLLIEKVLAWLETFYDNVMPTLVLNDVNLRNFIMVDDQLHGFDFEMVGEGDRIKEKAMILTMFLMYRPADTSYKISVVQRVLESLKDDGQQISALMDVCRQEIIERRGKKHPVKNKL